MKHLTYFENWTNGEYIFDDIKPKHKYNKGDYVKFIKKPYTFKITDVDLDESYKPYLITNINNNDFNYWAMEDELFTDEETELYNNQNKYNL